MNPDTDDSGLDIGTERDAFQEKQNDSLAVLLQIKWSCVEAGWFKGCFIRKIGIKCRSDVFEVGALILRRRLVVVNFLY